MGFCTANAAQTEVGASTAKLNGSIASPGATGADLVFVHMSGITQADVDQIGVDRKFTIGSSYPDVALDLSSQSDDIPFMVFGSAAFTAEAVSNLSVNFNFATSVISTYAYGLPAGGSVTGTTISKVNTAGRLHIQNLTVSASTPGRISKTVSAGINAAGQALFDIAVPKCDALPAGSSPRMIEIAISSTDHKVYFATFTGGTANARFMKCTVAGVPGFLLFPDYFVWPEGESAPEESTATNVNDGVGARYSTAGVGSPI